MTHDQQTFHEAQVLTYLNTLKDGAVAHLRRELEADAAKTETLRKRTELITKLTTDLPHLEAYWQDRHRRARALYDAFAADMVTDGWTRTRVSGWRAPYGILNPDAVVDKLRQYWWRGAAAEEALQTLAAIHEELTSADPLTSARVHTLGCQLSTLYGPPVAPSAVGQ